MTWTGFFNVLSVSSCILSMLACRYAVRAVTVAQELQAQNEHSPASRMASLEASQSELLEELQNLANRVKMMKVRRAADHVDDAKPRAGAMPDPYKDPDGWRTAMNSRLGKGKLPP